jgi:hypothetical protein
MIEMRQCFETCVYQKTVEGAVPVSAAYCSNPDVVKAYSTAERADSSNFSIHLASKQICRVCRHHAEKQ